MEALKRLPDRHPVRKRVMELALDGRFLAVSMAGLARERCCRCRHRLADNRAVTAQHPNGRPEAVVELANGVQRVGNERARQTLSWHREPQPGVSTTA